VHLWKVEAAGRMGEGKVPADEVLDYQGLAVWLKVAEGTLRHYVMEGRIPFVKIGAHVRFLKPEIETWLMERKGRSGGKAAGKGDVKAGPVRADGGMLPWEEDQRDKDGSA
jgi:excisionase family DNA binding protein